MTKTIDEYIAYTARKQAEKKYHQAMDNMEHEASSLMVDVQPSAFGLQLDISMGDKDKIIDELAESIEINMKNKLVEMLVDNDDK